MTKLLHDRYVAYDHRRGCDLATGDEVSLDALPANHGGAPDASVETLVEAMTHGRDGAPRWVVADVRNGSQAAALARRAAAGAVSCGLVPVKVSLYVRLRDVLGDDLAGRALLLIGGFEPSAAVDRAALLEAAARAPRPHVLLTFRTGQLPRPACVAHEARAEYAVERPPRGDAPPPHPEVARCLQRAGHAPVLERAGRHAAAERLLRGVAAMLVRRQAHAGGAETTIALGRLLLERGRAAAAEAAFGDAAAMAQAGGRERLAIEARLWQAAARTDAGRLTDGEAVCRAILLTAALPLWHRRWASAALARILLWQGRVEEACRLELTPDDTPDGAPPDEEPQEDVHAFVGATAAQVLLARGDVFAAGLTTGALLERAAGWRGAIPRAVASTARLRLASAAGDVDRAGRELSAVVALAREARAPLRTVRARLLWHDVLHRAGRSRDARREIEALARVRRALPPLLRRAVDARLDRSDACRRPPSTPMGDLESVSSSSAAVLVQLAQAEESDTAALEQVIRRTCRQLQASRVELVSGDAGPVSTLVSVGTGLPTTLGRRLLDAGIAIPGTIDPLCREAGVPVRLGSRLLGALVCRWPIDREPPGAALDALGLAGAVLAPRLDAFQEDARTTAEASATIPELVGVSGAMADVRRAVQRAAQAPFAVLIEGESGVGKELVARAIHQLGPRRERRFCDVNCAALPDDLLESELFGHARGAFTGAVADRAGLFEEADGGTIFLDEILDLSPRGQAKLLRVIQQHEVRRVGETFSRPIDVRLVAAANRDMRAEAAERRFRADLLYRLDVIRIRIPPLRERPEDVAVLAEHCWRSAASRVGTQATLSHDVLSALARYPWPGNVRELQNVMAALAVAAPARGRVRASLLPAAITGAACVTSRRLADARAQFERRWIEVALARADGRRTRAAAELGLSRQGLLKTMIRLRMTVPPCQGEGKEKE